MKKFLQSNCSSFNSTTKRLLQKPRKRGIALTSSFLDPRRHHDRGHPNPEAVELEEIWRGAGVPIRIRHIDIWSLDMVIESTVLIIGDDQECLIPLGASSECLIDLLNKLLPIGHIMRWVIIISRHTLEIEVPRLDDGQARQLPISSIFLERQIILMKLEDILQFPQVPIEQRVGYVLVINPKVYAILVERIKDGLLRKPFGK